MRVLIANYEFPPVGGGASKVSYELAKKLVEKGHDVVVLTSRYGNLDRFEKRDGIMIHRVWSWRKGIHDSGLRGAFTYLISALPVLRRILKTEPIDVVHYFFGLPTGLLSVYSHGIAKKPYIISLRGSDVPLYDRDSSKLMMLHRMRFKRVRSQ
jgi:glycosyltransferase involved in cell wall biosynthesis